MGKLKGNEPKSGESKLQKTTGKCVVGGWQCLGDDWKVGASFRDGPESGEGKAFKVNRRVGASFRRRPESFQLASKHAYVALYLVILCIDVQKCFYIVLSKMGTKP